PPDRNLLTTAVNLYHNGGTQCNSNRTQGKIPTSVNGYLINTGTKLVLIDAGAAGVFGPTLGQLVGNLKAAGYEPGQVDVVLITHLHGDHFGGLLGTNGKPAFPNATVYVPKADHDRWVAPKETSNEKAGKKPDLFHRIAAPYQALGRWKTLADGDEPAPGIRAVDASGHTPGQLAYKIQSDGRTLFAWGDLLHCGAIQLARPDVFVVYDADSPKAVASRKKLLVKLAADGTLIAGAHLPFPGLGRLRADGPYHYDAPARYAWVPVLFSSSP
ncbi:MAG: MBL fold metallo-hydrolase, partial [Pirellulales bacterium]|nr:MBL fold metallo-hydrolase [Pirellulales bacterium]